MNAVLYFAAYAQLGVMVTWWPLVILSLGGDAGDVGWIFSGRIAVSMAAQAIWPRLADRMGSAVTWLRWLQFLGFLPLLALPWVDSLAGLAALLWLSTLFHGAISPIQDAWVLGLVGPDGFGARRLWGSVGYGVVVAGFGLALAGADTNELARMAVLAAIAVSALGVVATWGLPSAAGNAKRSPLPATQEHTNAHRPSRLSLVLFLGMHGCHWGAISVFNVYLTTFTTSFGWSSVWPATAIGVAIVAEVIGLAIARRVGVTSRPVFWLVVLLGASMVRWLGMAWLPSAPLMVLLQMVHLVGFGFWLVLALHGVRERLSHVGPAAAQAWFAVVVLGCGGMLATAAAGALSGYASVVHVFVLAGALDGFALLLLAVDRRRGPRQRVA